MLFRDKIRIWEKEVEKRENTETRIGKEKIPRAASFKFKTFLK